MNLDIPLTQKGPGVYDSEVLYEAPRALGSIELESGMWFPGAGGGVGNYCLVETVSVLQDVKVLEMDRRDGCTTVWMCLVPLTCSLKNG